MSTATDRLRTRTVRIAARVRVRIRRIAASLRGTPLGTLIERTMRGFTAIEPFDRAMTLAAQSFVSIIPILIVIAALRPRSESIGSMMGDTLGLSDAVQATLAGSIPTDTGVASGIGLFGFLVAIFSATSYSRALERMYLRAWGVPKPPLRTAWRWLATIGALVVAIALIGLTQAILANLPLDKVLEILIRLVVWTVVWTYVPWVLMRTRITVRTLAFAGGLTAVALTVLAGFGRIYLPIVLTSGAEAFGVLGLVFTYISWLFTLSFAIVLATVVGNACAQDEGLLGRIVRGPTPDVAGVSGAVPPGPARAAADD